MTLKTNWGIILASIALLSSQGICLKSDASESGFGYTPALLLEWEDLEIISLKYHSGEDGTDTQGKRKRRSVDDAKLLAGEVDNIDADNLMSYVDRMKDSDQKKAARILDVVCSSPKKVKGSKGAVSEVMLLAKQRFKQARTKAVAKLSEKAQNGDFTSLIAESTMKSNGSVSGDLLGKMLKNMDGIAIGLGLMKKSIRKTQLRSTEAPPTSILPKELFSNVRREEEDSTAAVSSMILGDDVTNQIMGYSAAERTRHQVSKMKTPRFNASFFQNPELTKKYRKFVQVDSPLVAMLQQAERSNGARPSYADVGNQILEGDNPVSRFANNSAVSQAIRFVKDPKTEGLKLAAQHASQYLPVQEYVNAEDITAITAGKFDTKQLAQTAVGKLIPQSTLPNMGDFSSLIQTPLGVTGKDALGSWGQLLPGNPTLSGGQDAHSASNQNVASLQGMAEMTNMVSPQTVANFPNLAGLQSMTNFSYIVSLPNAANLGNGGRPQDMPAFASMISPRNWEKYPNIARLQTITNLGNQDGLQNVANFSSIFGLQNMANNVNLGNLQNMATSGTPGDIQNMANLENRGGLQNMATSGNQGGVKNVANFQSIGGIQNMANHVNLRGSRKMAPSGNLGGIQNMANFRNLGDVQNVANFPRIGGFQNTANSGNLGGIQNMANFKNLGGVQNVANFPRIGGLQNTANSGNLGGIQNMANFRNLGDVQNVANFPRIGGLQNTANSGNLEGIQNMANFRNLGDVQNVANFPRICGLQNTANSGNLGGIQNMANFRNLGDVQNVANFPRIGGLQNMANSGNLGGIQNMANFRNLGDVQNVANFPRIGGLQNTANSGNLGGIQNMANFRNLGDVQNVANFPRIGGLQNMANSGNLGGIQNMANFRNLGDVQNVANFPRIGGLQNTANSGNLEGIQNMANFRNLGDVQNVANFPRICGLQNTANSGNLGGIQNMANFRNLGDVQNVANFPRIGGLQNMANSGNLGGIQNMANFRNLGDVQNVANFPRIGGLQNTAYSGNLGRLQNMATSANLGGIQNMANLGNLGVIRNMATNINPGDLQNMATSRNQGGVQTLANLPSIGGLQNMANDVNLRGFQNIAPFGNLGGIQNMANFRNLGGVKNVPNFPTIGGLQTMANSGNLVGLQNMATSATLGGIQNMANLGNLGGNRNMATNVNTVGLQNIATSRNQGGVQNVANFPSIGGLRNMANNVNPRGFQSMAPFRNLGGTQNLANLGKLFGIRNMANNMNMGGLQNKPNVGNLGGLQNRATSATHGGMQNIANLGYLGGIRNMANNMNMGGLQNMSNLGILGGIQNMATSRNQAGVQNVANFPSIGGLQNMAKNVNLRGFQNIAQSVNLGVIQNMANFKNLGGVQNVANFPRIGGLQNMANSGNLGGRQNMATSGTLEGIQNMANLVNLGGIRKMGIIINPGGLQNMATSRNQGGVQNVANFPSIGGIQNLANVGNLGGLQNMANNVNLGSFQNILPSGNPAGLRNVANFASLGGLGNMVNNETLSGLRNPGNIASAVNLKNITNFAGISSFPNTISTNQAFGKPFASLASDLGAHPLAFGSFDPSKLDYGVQNALENIPGVQEAHNLVTDVKEVAANVKRGAACIKNTYNALKPSTNGASLASSFVGLLNNVSALRNGNEFAIGNIVSNSINIGADLLAYGLKAFGQPGGDEIAVAMKVSGAILGSFLNAGSATDSINSTVPLTNEERSSTFKKMMWSLPPPDHIQTILGLKINNNAMAKEYNKVLDENRDLKSIVAPSARETRRNNETETQFFCKLFTAWLGKCQSEKFDQYFDVQPYSYVDLDFKDEMWTHRGSPDNLSSNRKIFCPVSTRNLDKQYSPNRTHGLFFCDGAFGIEDRSRNKTLTLIDLEDGKDTAYGQPGYEHIFMVKMGQKNFFGQDEMDTFVLEDDRVEGHLNGRGGQNYLVIGDDYPRNTTLDLNTLEQGLGGLKITNISSITGREGRADRIILGCGSESVDGQGGGPDGPDIIIVNDNNCSALTSIQVPSKTLVNNNATRGQFDYWVHESSSHFHINLTGIDNGVKGPKHNVNLSFGIRNISRIVFDPDESMLNVTNGQFSMAMKVYRSDLHGKFDQPRFSFIDRVLEAYVHVTGSGKVVLVHPLDSSSSEVNNIRQGFSATKNLFLIKGGHWNVTGGSKENEYFIKGPFNGHIGQGMGQNILVISDSCSSSEPVQINLHEGLLTATETKVQLGPIHKVYGRRGQSEEIVIGRHTSFVDSKGGKSSSDPDIIEIPAILGHRFMVNLKISNHTTVRSHALEGFFGFQIIGVGQFDVISETGSKAKYVFIHPYNCTELKGVNYDGTTQKLEFITVQGQRRKHRVYFRPEKPYHTSPIILTQDNIEFNVRKNGDVTASAKFRNGAKGQHIFSGVDGFTYFITASNATEVNILGSDQDDVFTLDGGEAMKGGIVTGVIDAQGGENKLTLNFPPWKETASIQLNLYAGTLNYGDHSSETLIVRNFSSVEGRYGDEEVVVACETTEVNGKGGKDIIIIPDFLDCSNEVHMEIAVAPMLQVTSYAQKGTFVYRFNGVTHFDVDFDLDADDQYSGALESKHIYALDFSVDSIKEIEFDSKSKCLVYKINTNTIEHSLTGRKEDFYDQPKFMTNDGIQLKVSISGNIYLVGSLTESGSEVVAKFGPLAAKLNMTAMLKAGDEWVYIGDSGAFNVLTNDLNRVSHLVGNQANENTFMVYRSSHEVYIYSNPKNVTKNVLDLSLVVAPIRQAQGSKYKPKVTQSGQNMIMDIQGQIIHLVDATCWVKTLKIVLESAYLELPEITEECAGPASQRSKREVHEVKELELRPIPLNFKHQSVVLLSTKDLEDGVDIKLDQVRRTTSGGPNKTAAMAKLDNGFMLSDVSDGDFNGFDDMGSSLIIPDFYEMGADVGSGITISYSDGSTPLNLDEMKGKQETLTDLNTFLQLAEDHPLKQILRMAEQEKLDAKVNEPQRVHIFSENPDVARFIDGWKK